MRQSKRNPSGNVGTSGQMIYLLIRSTNHFTAMSVYGRIQSNGVTALVVCELSLFAFIRKYSIRCTLSPGNVVHQRIAEQIFMAVLKYGKYGSRTGFGIFQMLTIVCTFIDSFPMPSRVSVAGVKESAVPAVCVCVWLELHLVSRKQKSDPITFCRLKLHWHFQFYRAAIKVS